MGTCLDLDLNAACKFCQGSAFDIEPYALWVVRPYDSGRIPQLLEGVRDGRNSAVPAGMAGVGCGSRTAVCAGQGTVLQASAEGPAGGCERPVCDWRGVLRVWVLLLLLEALGDADVWGGGSLWARLSWSPGASSCCGRPLLPTRDRWRP